MTILQEYLSKGWTHVQLEEELNRLINEYSKVRECNLLVYAATPQAPVPDVALSQKDFYFIKDLLDGCAKKKKKLDIYLETPGGSGEAAEEIVKYIRKKYKDISFVICGEAKSAGTILAMSGDEILMTDTGSLGPIDAQMVIGRSQVSAYDYTDWVEEKRKEAETKPLNQVDIAILAQISPGELKGAINAQEYAVEMVKEWLANYKFKNWTKTATRGIAVTKEMREERASEIARDLNNHNKWKTHGRSLKKEDLESIKLNITDIEKDDTLKDLVYRIHTICRLLYMSGNTYKIIATENNKLVFTFNATPPVNNQIAPPEVVEIDTECPNCKKVHNLYIKLKDDKTLDEKATAKGRIKFPENNILTCECGFELNLIGIRNDIEAQTKIKTID